MIIPRQKKPGKTHHFQQQQQHQPISEMKIKNGTVKYPANKVFQSDWGERQNIVVDMDDGSTEKLYFAAGRQPHASLKRGESVQVLYEGGKRRLLVNDKPDTPIQQPQPQPQYQGLTPDTKRAIANYVQDQADLLGFCLKMASEKFGNQIETEESLRTLATTLFIATQRHFGL